MKRQSGTMKIRKGSTDKKFDFFLYLIAAVILIIMIYPMYFVVIASISNPTEIGMGNVVFWPKGVTLSGYRQLLKNQQLWIGYRNTIFYTVLGTMFSLVFNISAGYVLSRRELFGRKILTAFYLIPMFFSGGLIPTYLQVKNAGLLDTIWVLVMAFAVSTYNIIVARTFFMNSIPEDMREAAQLDGCGNLNYFFRIALPLSKAVIAVIGLWAAVGQWNSYFNALIYIRDDNLVPLQLVLRNVLISNQLLAQAYDAKLEELQLAELTKYTIIVISSAPIMCLYPFVQKYFNQGLMVGSLKG